MGFPGVSVPPPACPSPHCLRSGLINHLPRSWLSWGRGQGGLATVSRECRGSRLRALRAYPPSWRTDLVDVGLLAQFGVADIQFRSSRSFGQPAPVVVHPALLLGPFLGFEKLALAQ